MKTKAIVTTAAGVGIALLGLLWFLQGADVLHVRPILCVANCEPLVGGSTGWLMAGAVGMLVGILVIRWGLKRGHPA